MLMKRSVFYNFPRKRQKHWKGKNVWSHIGITCFHSANFDVKDILQSRRPITGGDGDMLKKIGESVFSDVPMHTICHNITSGTIIKQF